MTVVLNSDSFPGVAPSLMRLCGQILWKAQSAKPFDVAFALGVPLPQATPIWSALLAQGFIERKPDGTFRPTENMYQLSHARLGKLLPRQKAEKLLDELVKRVIAINNLPPECGLYQIKRLAVFGSYALTDKAMLGDLDVGWETCWRPGATGEDRYGHGARLDYEGTKKKLFPTSRYVRPLSIKELDDLKFEYKVVYELQE